MIFERNHHDRTFGHESTHDVPGCCPFLMWLAEIVAAVGDKIDVIVDSGIQRGTHVLRALSLGAKAVGVGH